MLLAPGRGVGRGQPWRCGGTFRTAAVYRPGVSRAEARAACGTPGQAPSLPGGPKGSAASGLVGSGNPGAPLEGDRPDDEAPVPELRRFLRGSHEKKSEATAKIRFPSFLSRSAPGSELSPQQQQPCEVGRLQIPQPALVPKAGLEPRPAWLLGRHLHRKANVVLS